MAILSGNDIVSIVFSAYQDAELREAAQRIRTAEHEYKKALAEAGRLRTDALIRTMAKIDIEVEKFKHIYQKLTDEEEIKDNSLIRVYLRNLELEKRKLKEEKRKLKEGRRII